MGLDIRTGGEENQPVYSVEDGYISRVKIEPGGYGKAIFVTHTNGLTSLYAHLNRYAGKIEEYITARQYKTKSWQQDVSFSPGQYPVRKDELIAYSGNTGHSEGPHVHFELRDTKTGNHLNPALYGFEVRDNTPPEIVGLYWYDRRYSTYENDPFAIDIVGSKGEYKSRRKTVKVTSPLISLGIHADDKVEGSRFSLWCVPNTVVDG
jgi:Membrane proteins related to metalloendopeptidases